MLDEITKWSELPTVSMIKYDVGTHVRCMEFHTADGASSEKAGGFSLDKEQDFSEKEVGKIICQAISTNDAVTRIEFFDRNGDPIVKMVGSSSLSGVEKVTEIAKDEKLVGFQIDHDGNVVYGASFVIAKSGAVVNNE